MRKLFLVAVLAFLLIGCKEDTVVIATEEAEVTTTEVTVMTEAPLPPSVSPLASEHFLEPFDDYSWEREFDAEYVMIHFTSAVMLSRDDPYNIETVRKIFEDGGISIHYLIDRDGSIYCYMPETRAAWHAGKGTLADDERLTNKMNKYSVGIELLAIGSENDMAQYLSKEEYRLIDASLIGYTDAQYESLAKLVNDVCERNSIPFDRDHIIGHEEYNPQKSDPGELFDWERLVK